MRPRSRRRETPWRQADTNAQGISFRPHTQIRLGRQFPPILVQPSRTNQTDLLPGCSRTPAPQQASNIVFSLQQSLKPCAGCCEVRSPALQFIHLCYSLKRSRQAFSGPRLRITEPRLKGRWKIENQGKRRPLLTAQSAAERGKRGIGGWEQSQARSLPGAKLVPCDFQAV